MQTPEATEPGWRAQIEAAFETWGRFVFRNAWAALLLSVAVTVWLASYLPQLVVDNSTESLLLSDDPAVLAYNAARDEFGRDDRVMLAVAAPDLFDQGFLERLRSLHQTLEAEVPYLVEVDSLLNARVTLGDEEGLSTRELFEDWPEDAAALAALRDYAFTNPLYKNTLISEDRQMTALLLKPATYSQAAAAGGHPEEADLSGFEVEPGGDSAGFESDAEGEPPVYLTAREIDELMGAVHRVVKQFDADGFRLHIAGAMAMTDRINRGMNRDMSIMLPLAAAIMSAVLAVLFRRTGGVLLPLSIVALSLLATLGTMIALGIPGSTAVQILPVFLLTVGVCDAVHILTLVYRMRAEGAEKEEAVAKALGHSGLAVLMTSLTTAAGMASFVTAEMAAVMHLGILAPIGVGMAFLYTVVLLPALLSIFPLPVPRARKTSATPLPFEGALVSAGRFAARNPARILVPTGLLFALGILGALQLEFSHNGISWFPEDDRLPIDFRAIDDSMRGSVSVDVLVDTGAAGGLYEPAKLESIDTFLTHAQLAPAAPLFIGKTLSVLDIVKETHQALNENRPEMRRIPETRDLVAQELLLFENSGSEDTEEFVDSEYRRARLSLWVPFSDALLYPPLLDKLRTVAEKRLGPDMEFEMTGIMTLLAEVIDAVIRSMMRSYAFALTVITPLMMLLLGSLRRGLVSMVPNLLPAVAVIGVCGGFGIKLDSTTMIVGAMVIGIAVDDTIHFMHKFHRYFEISGNVETAIEETLRTTGSALLFTTLVLIAGFLVFELATMTNMRIFGGLAAMATAVAFLADLLVAPALLSVVERYRKQAAAGA